MIVFLASVYIRQEAGGSSEGLPNVRYWLKADIPAYVGLCPLLGVKRTWDLPLRMSAYDPKRTSYVRVGIPVESMTHLSPASCLTLRV